MIDARSPKPAALLLALFVLAGCDEPAPTDVTVEYLGQITDVYSTESPVLCGTDLFIYLPSVSANWWTFKISTGEIRETDFESHLEAPRECSKDGAVIRNRFFRWHSTLYDGAYAAQDIYSTDPNPIWTVTGSYGTSWMLDGQTVLAAISPVGQFISGGGGPTEIKGDLTPNLLRIEPEDYELLIQAVGQPTWIWEKNQHDSFKRRDYIDNVVWNRDARSVVLPVGGSDKDSSPEGLVQFKFREDGSVDSVELLVGPDEMVDLPVPFGMPWRIERSPVESGCVARVFNNAQSDQNGVCIDDAMKNWRMAEFVPDPNAAGRSVVAIYGAEMDEKGFLISLGNDTIRFYAIQIPSGTN